MTRVSILLLLGLIVSGLFLVKVSYDERRLFAELEKAKAEEQQLIADAKRVAREKLGMRMAAPDVTRYVSDTRPATAASGAQP